MAAIAPSPNAYCITEKGGSIITLIAGEEIKQGWLVGVNPATGKAAKAGGAGIITLGKAETHAPADGEEVSILRGCFFYPADDGLTLDGKQIGQIAYAQNQNSVTTASSKDARPAGLVLGYQDGKLLIDTTLAPILPTPAA